MVPSAPRAGEENIYASSGKRPLLRAVRVDGIEIVIIRSDVDGAVRPESRGGTDNIAGGNAHCCVPFGLMA